MDRREFLKSTGAAAAAATAATTAVAQSSAAPSTPEGVAAPSLATGLKELRLATSWPDAASGPVDQGRRLGQRLTAMSGGRYRIALLPGIDNGLAAVRAGEADLYYASEHDHLEAHRALAYFSGLPGDRGIAARHLSAWMLVGGGQQLWDDLAAELGVKAMLAGHTGERPCFLAARGGGGISELVGERVVVPGLARDVVRGFGLEPVALPPSEIADALAGGKILAAECGGAIASHALGLLRVASHSVGASVNRHGSAVALGLRRPLWNSLSASDQALFAAAAAAEYELALAEEEAHRRFLYPEPGADKTWPQAHELSRTISRVADAVVAHVAASDLHAQRINARNCLIRADRTANNAMIRQPTSCIVAATGRQRRGSGGIAEIQYPTGLRMSMTEMAQVGAQSTHADSTDAQMEQIRELLVGDILRRADARVEALEARVRELEGRLEALGAEQTASRRSAFDELARGVAELGERIRHLAQS